MTYACPKCHQWWVNEEPQGWRRLEPSAFPTGGFLTGTVRWCPQCEGAQAAHEDERENRRQDVMSDE